MQQYDLPLFFFFALSPSASSLSNFTAREFSWKQKLGRGEKINEMMCSLSVSFLIGVYAVSALGLPCTPSSSFAFHGTVTRHRHGTWTRHELRHTTMNLRGGSETEAAVTDETKDASVGFAAQLYSALKENKSLDPNDHPTSLQWALAGSYEWNVYKFSFKVHTFGRNVYLVCTH